MSGIEAGYLGATFGRPYDGLLPGQEDYTEENVDMWATAEEDRDQLADLYRRVWAHSDATIAALPLDATGRVPWWPEERRDVTLHQVLVHVVAETHRHAGHADILRELIDGLAGRLPGNDNLAPRDRQGWEAQRARLEAVAREAADR